MPSHQVKVFISHSWSYSGHYEKLAEWLFETKWNVDETPLLFLDRSVPADNPIHNADTVRELRGAIYERILDSHVVIIPTGMYASYSKWIQEEIAGAADMGVPILAVDPWGQERKSSVVVENSDDQAGWTGKSVVSKTWRLYQKNG